MIRGLSLVYALHPKRTSFVMSDLIWGGTFKNNICNKLFARPGFRNMMRWVGIICLIFFLNGSSICSRSFFVQPV